MPAKIAVAEGQKWCPTCQKAKPFADFHRNRSTADGMSVECKPCRIGRQKSYTARPEVRARINAQRHASPEVRAKLREEYRRAYEKRKTIVAEYKRRPDVKTRDKETAKAPHRVAAKKRYYASDLFRSRLRRQMAKYPETFKARNAVCNAVRRGKLSPAKCFTCPCGKPAQQYHHHKGYDPEHWLDVTPLCRACHRKADGQ